MTAIKAIETQYKGYRFRSRLEARWAVCFDAWNEPYEYEPEGFDIKLENGETIYYLPDFKLTNHKHGQLWLDIKPNRELLQDEIEKAVAFSLASHEALILLCGDPWYETIGYEFGCRGGEYYAGLPVKIMQCPSSISDKNDSPHIAWINPNIEECKPPKIPLWQWKNIYNAVTKSDWIMRGYIAGRSARFEHGEKPNL